jgi:LysM repeat protein
LFSPTPFPNIPAVRKRFLLLPVLVLAGAAFGQPTPTEVDFANLREDVRGLTQRVNDLSLQVEQLERENGLLQSKAEEGDRGYATLVQLDAAVAALNQTIQTTVAASKDDTLAQIGARLDKLAQQVNAALNSLGKKPGAPAAFSEDFPKTGESYTVQRGDTLALIAKKTGAKIQDIINANKIADPSRIQAGQTLFVPGGK